LRTETSISGLRPSSPSSVSGVSSPAAIPPLTAARKRTWVWIATAGGLLCAAALAIFLLRKSSTATGPLEITRLTTEGGLCVDPAISPDGKLLAYASDRSGEGHFSIWLRQIGGGDAVRLTHDPADDLEPDFSPDGTRIVFRSTREGGGLYIIPALGGEVRKIADNGRQPQFSPDGSRIAYWTGPADPMPLREGIAHAFIIDLATSTSRRLRTDFAAEVHPVWSPDGSHLLFVGLKDPKDIQGTFDWWIVPINDGNAVLCPMIGQYVTFDPFAWPGDRVYLTKNDGGRTTIGMVRLDHRTFQPVGTPRGLTAGTTDEYSPSISKEGKLVFSSIDARSDLYSLPLDAKRGKVRGEAQRLTRNIGNNLARSISADGKRLAFTSDRSGVTQIWVKDLVSGQEHQLTTGVDKTQPFISPDGQVVAWRDSGTSNTQIFITPFNGGLLKPVCADCGVPTGWSPDGRYLVFQPTSNRHLSIALLEVGTGKKIDYLKSADLQFSAGSISADGKWIVFATPRTLRDFTIFVAPFSPDRPPPRSDWVEIVHSPEVDPDAQWSPDGNLLYFSSDRDGYNCLWAQRLDQVTKRPKGELFAVQHFHTPSQVLRAPAVWYPATLGPDKVVVSLEERSGGIWMLNPKD